ncbi:MAG TPA: hypothetical protein VFI13_13910 [Gemmatimonadales bacterium]|nr:hypothetical protein [Gemmatimonadales bacterium]
MSSTCTDARESIRNATRASLLAARSMVDARIRRVERRQAAILDRRAAGASHMARTNAGDRPPAGQPPHEVV